MKSERYSINEILSAIDELQSKKKTTIKEKTFFIKKKTIKNEIPFDTLRLIEEAEKIIRSKLQSK